VSTISSEAYITNSHSMSEMQGKRVIFTRKGSVCKKKDTFYSHATKNNFEDWVIDFQYTFIYHITHYVQYYLKHKLLIRSL